MIELTQRRIEIPSHIDIGEYEEAYLDQIQHECLLRELEYKKSLKTDTYER